MVKLISKKRKRRRRSLYGQSYYNKKRARSLQKKLTNVSENKINSIEDFSMNTISSIKILCSNCNKEITNYIKFLFPQNVNNINSKTQKTENTTFQKSIKIKPENNNNISLFEINCLSCFISKYKNKKESENLSYSIIDKLNKHQIFTEDWSIRDELKLLGAIEKLGLDNWDEISKNIGKGIHECEAHYYTFYYKNNKDNIPEIVNIMKNKEIGKKNKNKENIEKEKIIKNITYIPFSNNENNNNNINRSRSLVKNRKNKKDGNQILANASEILGYWRKRREFEIEYLNDAELGLSEIEFFDNDSKEKYEENIQNLKIYNAELDERIKRKEFVIERNLFDVKKQINFEKKLLKEDREIYNSLKPFYRFVTNEQFNNIYEGAILEKNIKLRLNQLKYYKDLGCKTYDDIQKEIEKMNQKLNKKENKNKKDIKNNVSENNIKKFLRNSKTNFELGLGEEEILEAEKKFLEKIGIPRITFNEIKKKVKKEMIEEGIKKDILIKKIIDKHDIEKKKIEKIIDYILEYSILDFKKKI